MNDPVLTDLQHVGEGAAQGDRVDGDRTARRVAKVQDVVAAALEGNDPRRERAHGHGPESVLTA